MALINVEIKARCKNPDKIRKILKEKNADFKGMDHQIDTYFKCENGRLKLREGNIENNLIYYDRENRPGPKKADIILYKPGPDSSGTDSSLKEILEKSLGILAVTDKNREIYFIDNVKFHIDIVKNLGSFVEIEAIDRLGNIGEEKLYEQCRGYMDLFGIKDKDLMSTSYSDMILK
ncbi:MAG: class IV adenylate cyclase [Candidatus Eremiobacteraeota bacterium]|nr:class IV adenylate cyclase [Candidatus Eremiobacteraeota bacterium]